MSRPSAASASNHASAENSEAAYFRSTSVTSPGAAFSKGAPLWAFGAGVVLWALFAWALNPPMQASTIAAAPEAAMTAVSLNISGLYLGTAVAGAAGRLVLDRLGAPAVPVAGTVALMAACLIAAPPEQGPHFGGR